MVSDRGLAQRTLEELIAEPIVTLEPWGGIRGQLRVGTNVGVGRLVGAVVSQSDHRGEPAVSLTSRALTDADGRFLMDRVAPGHAMIFRPHWFADGTSYHSHRRGVDIASGQQVELTLGGAGRPVIGRITRAAGLPSFDLDSVTGRLRFVQPTPRFPEGFQEWVTEKQQRWWRAYFQTEEGRRYYERANAYVVKVEPDGSFRLDDVPGGRYRLNFEFETVALDSSKDPNNVPTRIAVLEIYFVTPSGPDHKPMDLGTLTLTPPAPDVVDQ